MTMHLERPWLSLSGSKKAKPRFASAAQKRDFEQREASWEALKSRHTQRPSKAPLTGRASTLLTPATYIRGSELPRLPSRDTGAVPCLKRDDLQYTGEKMLGVSTLHKSNSVPVFSNDDILAIARMRR